MRGRGTSLVLSIIVILSTFCFVLTILPENVTAKTLCVGGFGPGNYTTIQAAINDANPGDIILIYDGFYFEDIVVDKSLTITGVNRDTTTIDGIGYPIAVNVTADWVNMSDLTVMISMPGTGAVGIGLHNVSDCHLNNITISQSYHGIRFLNSDRNLISNVTISDLLYGITLQDSLNNQVRNNTIDTVGATGIQVFDSHHNIIAGNIVDEVYLLNSDYNKVLLNEGEFWLVYSHGNILANNTQYHGIWLEESHNNTFAHNTILSLRRVEIDIRLSDNTTIMNNTAPNATYIDVFLLESSYARFHDQAMIGNGRNESGGIYIEGDSLDHWNTHSIDTSNTLNGKPVYYLANTTGGTVPSDMGQIILANCSGVLAENLNISGAGMAVALGFSSNNTIMNSNLSENFLGVYLEDSHDNLITNNDASITWDGVDLWSSNNNTITNNDLGYVYAEESSHNIIKDNNLSYFGSGVFLGYSSNHNILHNNSVTYWTIYLFLSENNTISNNTVWGNMDGIFIDEAHNNMILNNTVSIQDDVGMYSYFSDGNTISGNQIAGSRGAIYLSDSSRTILRDNVMVDNGVFIEGDLLGYWNTHDIDSSNVAIGKPMIYWANATTGTIPANAGQVILANCSHVLLENQNLSNVFVGLELGFSSNNTISNVTSFGNWRAGAYLKSSENNTIHNFTVGYNRYMGIHLEGSNFNRIDNSTFSLLSTGTSRALDFSLSNSNVLANNTLLNSPTGMYFRFQSNDNTILGNIISRCRVGLSVSSDGNEIIENTMILNTNYGIYINGDSNRVYHNNIVSNGQQARDDGGLNQWDDGYPSGGNYWSDYKGDDLMSGVNQDQPGNDGIGDTPYNLIGAIDNYPLMSPVGGMPVLPPPAPQNLRAVAGDGEVLLTWNESVSPAPYPVTSYDIYRGITPGGEWFPINPGNVTNYNDTNVVNGQIYYYIVYAENEIGYSPPSNEAYATPTTTPGAPLFIGAFLSGMNFENVTLRWTLSPDDGAGQDSIVGYRIYRNRSYDANGSSYGLIGFVPSGSSEFIDNLTGEGDPNNYFYRICAMDLNDRTNCSANQGAKFTRSISKGINLASVPLIQSDENIGTILQTVSYNDVWAFDPMSGDWRFHSRSKPYGTPFAANHSLGFWVSVLEDSNLTVAGLVPSVTTIHLWAGWNLVGFPSFNATYTVADLKAETGATRVETFDPNALPYFLREMQDSDSLLAGEGYWVYVTTDVIWQVRQ